MWRRWVMDRDREARERLILRFAPLVTAVVAGLHRRMPPHIDRADLTAAGTLGLIAAVDRFEPSRGVPFAGYATQRIRGSVLDELRRDDWLPRTARSAAKGTRQAADRLRGVLHREPTDKEIATETGLKIALVRESAAARSSAPDSADDSFHHVDRATGHRSGGPGTDPASAFDRAETARLLSSAIHRLDGRQQVAVALYYFEGMRLSAIGRVLGVSDSRVSQLLAAAHRALRQLLVVNGVSPRCSLGG